MINDLSAAFNERDFSRFERWADPEIVFDFTRSIGLQSGTYRGHAALAEFFETFIEAWEEVNWEATRVEEVDEDHLLVTSRMSGRGRGSGIEVDAQGAQSWELHDGKVLRVTMFQTRNEAAAALGL